MDDCLFCRLVAGEIPTTTVYEDDDVLAFEDIHPKAPVHILIIPKTHISTINDIGPEQEVIIGRLYSTAAKLAAEMGFAEEGYRVVMNCNRDAGQTVYHIHLHLLAGRAMGWPPG